jgi:glycosyltransferase involved in cell wall biosynthesis
MKIALIAPGIMPVPPPGWGAVEILIWDYYNELLAAGHNVVIINKIRSNPQDQSNPGTAYCRDLISEINNGGFDFVHLHYDVLFHIVPFLTSSVIGITSHYPYIDNLDKHNSDGFTGIFNFMIQLPRAKSQGGQIVINLVLADKDISTLIRHGADARYIYKLENGIAADKFICKSSLEATHRDKTIYLGKITPRKGQARYCNLEGIHIVGPGGEGLPNYQGAWSRDDVYSKLGDYGNLLLLSEGEADPLVVKEAMMAGLGVVINSTSGKNLDRDLDFISIIPDSRLDDLDYIQCVIDNNRKISFQKRETIQQYAREHFSWPPLISRYIGIIEMQLVPATTSTTPSTPSTPATTSTTPSTTTTAPDT